MSAEGRRLLYGLMARYICASSNNTSSEHLTARVIELVKKFDKIDASKVTYITNIIYVQLCCTFSNMKNGLST